MKNLCENEGFDDKFSSEGGHTAWNPYDSSSPCYLYKHVPIWSYILLLLLSTSFLSFETKIIIKKIVPSKRSKTNMIAIFYLYSNVGFYIGSTAKDSIKKKKKKRCYMFILVGPFLLTVEKKVSEYINQNYVCLNESKKEVPKGQGIN
jgi:hypothetical protein